MLLALDTSTRQAGVALYDGVKGLIAEYNWHSANRHTVELMPQVAQMLAQAGVQPADLTGGGAWRWGRGRSPGCAWRWPRQRDWCWRTG